MTPAPGSFTVEEYAARLARAQAGMAKRNLSLLLLTTPADIAYFTGFLTRFWESPTRPWYLILPAAGCPVAVIPAIGQALMARTWVDDIRCWQAPDLADEGITLLADTLLEIAGNGGKTGVPMGHESHLRMPLDDWQRLKRAAPEMSFVSDDSIVARQRMIKSPSEIAHIRAACNIAAGAFARVPEIARAGVPLDQVFRRFQMLCLEEGADWVAYLAGAAAQGGYGDVISPADPRELKHGDVLMLDTGLVNQGYFCDFDRNYSVGPPSDTTASAYQALINAAEAGFHAARPGATAADLFHAMRDVVGGPLDGGRFGHGIGLQLTEGCSLMPHDQTVLAAGMVLALEPVISLPGGQIMVHEENIVIADGGAHWLSPRAPRTIPVLEG